MLICGNIWFLKVGQSFILPLWYKLIVRSFRYESQDLQATYT